MLNSIRLQIPNAITCLNIFAGSMATVAAFESNFEAAALWIFAAALFDFLDGFVARLLRAYSPMGKELDSLGDCISFGLAPGMMLFTLLSSFTTLPEWSRYFAFLLIIFSALRLAKFNVDERQTTSFIGLPTPANALFWVALLWSYQTGTIPFVIPEWAFLLLAPLFSFFLISEIPMFSLKVKNISFKKNKVRYLFLSAFVAFVAVWGSFGVAVGILFYVMLSAITAKRG